MSDGVLYGFGEYVWVAKHLGSDAHMWLLGPERLEWTCQWLRFFFMDCVLHLENHDQPMCRFKALQTVATKLVQKDAAFPSLHVCSVSIVSCLDNTARL